MIEMPDVNGSLEDDDPMSDTLIVPPPNFRERLLAAQKARKASDVRQSVELPNPLLKAETLPESATRPSTPNARPEDAPAGTPTQAVKTPIESPAQPVEQNSKP
jgi:hypothetical protein